MKRRILKTLIVACSLLAVYAAEPKPASAGIVSDAWWALFGPPGTPWFGGGAYGYGAYGAYGAYYGGYPGYYRAYSNYPGGYFRRPACPSPCYTPCNPCYTPCNPCAPCGSSGPCAVGDSSGGAPRTFKDGERSGKKPPLPMGDSNFENREDSKGFGPTREKVKKQDNKKPGAGDGGKPPAPGKTGADGFPKTSATSVVRETLKPADGTTHGCVVRRRKPAPAKPPLETERRIDRLELDGRITWKPVVRRTRLIINAKRSSPNIARTTVDPNARWEPVPGGTRIVRK